MKRNISIILYNNNNNNNNKIDWLDLYNYSFKKKLEIERLYFIHY